VPKEHTNITQGNSANKNIFTSNNGNQW